MKKFGVLILSIGLVFLLAACGETKSQDRQENKQKETVDENKKQDRKEEELAEEGAEEEKDAQVNDEGEESEQKADSYNKPLDLTEGDPILVDIYHSNSDASDFEVTQEEIYTLDIGQIMQHLVKHGVISESAIFNSFQILDDEGETAIIMDMPQAFSEYLNGMGTAEEYMTIGSVVNTVLTAYQADKIKITIDGDEFGTGHAEYPGYMRAFTQTQE